VEHRTDEDAGIFHADLAVAAAKMMEESKKKKSGTRINVLEVLLAKNNVTMLNTLLESSNCYKSNFVMMC
jgi:hypothetical protein